MSDKVDVEVGVTLNIECVEELVLTFREILKQNGATNFLMLRFNDRGESKEYLVTIQVAGGKTPIERIAELEAELEASKSATSAVLRTIQNLKEEEK